jgi:hypothetical protein
MPYTQEASAVEPSRSPPDRFHLLAQLFPLIRVCGSENSNFRFLYFIIEKKNQKEGVLSNFQHCGNQMERAGQ